MKRTVRIKMDFVVEIDDPGEGLPKHGPPLDILTVAAQAFPGVTAIMPGGRVELGLTRESSLTARRNIRRG